MNIEALKEFCSNDDTQPTITEPWVEDGNIYATDGHMLLILPVADRPGLSAGKPGRKPSIEAFLAKVPEPVEYFPCPELPEIKAPQACKKCYGTGEIECYHCGHDMECDSCGGEGTDSTTAVRVSIGGVEFDARYLVLFRRHFPDFKVGPTGHKTPAKVTFPGGVGFIMPMRPESGRVT